MDEATIKHCIIAMVNKINDMLILKKIYTFVYCWFVKG